MELGGSQGGKVDGKDLISLRRQNFPLPALPLEPGIILANGDTIPGEALELAGEDVRFRAHLGKEKGLLQDLKLPLSALAVIWVTVPEHMERPDLFRRKLLSSKRERDTVLLRNGDALEGVLNAFDRKTIRIEVDKKESSTDFGKLALIALNTDLANLTAPEGPFARLVLANGARLTLRSALSEGKSLKCETLFGAEIEVPLTEIVALEIFGGRAVYLSDLKPGKYEFVPYHGSLRWSYVFDGNTSGGELRLDASTYDKGIGMHSESQLTFDLGAGYRRFETLVGLDDQEGREGSAGIKVLVDGKARDLGWNGALLGGEKPRTIKIDVAGAKSLTLVVEFGRRFDVQGRVNWADALLIR